MHHIKPENNRLSPGPILIILFAAALLCPSFLVAQNQNLELKESFLEAESYFLFEEYNEALPLYSKIRRAMPDNNNVNYKIGVCYLNDFYQKDKSIFYLELASQDINPKYKENSWKETSAPLETFYYLGDAYLANNNIDKALENYEHFLSILDEEIYDVELVEAQIQTCENARHLMSIPIDYESNELNERISSRFSENNPILSGNGKYMVFTRELQFYDGIFISEKVDGEWQAPRNLDPELQIDVDETVYPTSLSYDGKTMILYRNDEFIGNLYMSELVDGQWLPLVKLGPSINTKYWESHGVLSKDGKTLYFTSNRKSSKGGLDIYSSKLQDDGTWGMARNLGETINTRYNEETPFISENGQLLYFSSYGHYNMGGYDIFYSIKGEDGEWGTPVNMGYPINTTDDDLSFFPVNNGYNAYYSQYKDGGYGRHDIYYLDVYSDNNPRMYMITGSLDSEDGPITSEDSMMIYLIDTQIGDTVLITKPNLETQRFEIKAPKGDYDLLMRSTTYDDLVKRIRIDKNTEKTGIDFEDELVLETKEYKPQLLSGEESRVVLKDSLDLATAADGDSLSIDLETISGSTLHVYHYVDSVLVGIDTIFVSDSTTLYKLEQLQGDNTLKFIMVEENGDTSEFDMNFNVDESLAQQEQSHSDSIQVAQVKPDPEELLSPEQQKFQDDMEDVLESASEDVALALGENSLAELGISNEEELYEYLEDQDVPKEDINELKIVSDSDNDAEELREMLTENSNGPLKTYLEQLDLEAEGIESAEELIQHLKEVIAEDADTAMAFESDDLDKAIARAVAPDTPVEESRFELISLADEGSSEGDAALSNYLYNLDVAEGGLQTKSALIEHLKEVAGEEFPNSALVPVLASVVEDIPTENTIDQFKKNGHKNIYKFLKKADLEAEGIESAEEIVSYLKANLDKLGISEEELDQILVEVLSDLAMKETSPGEQGDSEGLPGSDSNAKDSKKGRTLPTILLLGAGLIFIILFIRKRRKDEKE